MIYWISTEISSIYSNNNKWKANERKSHVKLEEKKRNTSFFWLFLFCFFLLWNFLFIWIWFRREREREWEMYMISIFIFLKEKATLKITKREFIRVTMEPKRRRITKSHVLVIKYTSGHTHTHKSQRIKFNFLFIYLI